MSNPAAFSKLFSLDGKVAVVTGGSRGLGFYTAKGFLLAGAKLVIITARKMEGVDGLKVAVEQLNKLPGITGSAIAIAADISKESGVNDLIAKIQQEVDYVDILVANAGTTWGGPFETTPAWAIAKVLILNVQGVFNLIQKMLPLLEKAGTPKDPARIIIVGSIAGMTVPHIGKDGTIIYGVSKAAAHHLAKSLAVELGPRNITTNAVAPGFFPSKLADVLIERLGGEGELGQHNPRDRLGEPEDVIGAMTYLSSPAGSYVNGMTMVLDGGSHIANGRLTKL
ncbi:hypothetical protein BKA56DRAFT_503549 [Ilyonectria sp. MPI-CAGE-AT-0026]|nr:hypothetical protein BKA56DRAFT_503549 [Ilyonectria sp. MPI-CAGE-AT-0026]